MRYSDRVVSKKGEVRQKEQKQDFHFYQAERTPRKNKGIWLFAVCAVVCTALVMAGVILFVAGRKNQQNKDILMAASVDSSGKESLTLQADEVYLYAMMENVVTFTIRSAGEEDIFLCCDGKDTIRMRDDGAEGDETAGDGVYSTRLTFPASADEIVRTYWAECGKDRSSEVALYFFTTPTDEEYQAHEDLGELFREKAAPYVAEGYVAYEDVDKIINEFVPTVEALYDDGVVLDYAVDDTSISVKFASGLSTIYQPTQEDVLEGGSDATVHIRTYQPHYEEYKGIQDVDTLPSETAVLLKENLPNASYETDYKNTLVSTDAVDAFGPNNLILWTGHGGYSSMYHSYLGLGTEFHRSEYTWERITGQIVSIQTQTDKFFAVTPKYIKKHVGDMDGSIVYLNTCYSGKDSVLADAFLEKNAVAVLANTEKMYSYYACHFQYTMMAHMVEIDPDTGMYYTLGSALDAAKQVLAKTDVEWYLAHNQNVPSDRIPAETILFGGADAENLRLINGEVQNVPTDQPTMNKPKRLPSEDDSALIQTGAFAIGLPDFEDASELSIEDIMGGMYAAYGTEGLTPIGDFRARSKAGKDSSFSMEKANTFIDGVLGPNAKRIENGVDTYHGYCSGGEVTISGTDWTMFARIKDVSFDEQRGQLRVEFVDVFRDTMTSDTMEISKYVMYLVERSGAYGYQIVSLKELGRV